MHKDETWHIFSQIGIHINKLRDLLSYLPSKLSRSYNEDSYSYLNIQTEETRKKNISDNTTDLSLSENTNTEMQSDSCCTISIIRSIINLFWSRKCDLHFSIFQIMSLLVRILNDYAIALLAWRAMLVLNLWTMERDGSHTP